MKKLLSFLVIALFVSLALFADWANEEKVLALDGAELDEFGYTVSISGDYAVIGAYYDDDEGENSGSAYIFHFDGSNWSQQQKLIPMDCAAQDHFGFSVSIDGDYAVIGSPDDDDSGDHSGSAYIFYNNGSSWLQQQKLTASDGSTLACFGNAVSISGDDVVIGASLDITYYYFGAAYVFHRADTLWTEQAKLTADDGAAYDYFGNSVSISGGNAVIGAVADDDNGLESGSAYIFQYADSVWSQQQKLTPDDAAAHDGFGYSVFISGDEAMIGKLTDETSDHRGAVYVFHYADSVWSQQQKLTANDALNHSYFGCSISISGNVAVFGAYGAHDNGEYPGSAYIFYNDGSSWLQQQKLTPTDGAAYDYFGNSVSISGGNVVIGAYCDDDTGEDSGSAYFYENEDISPDTPTNLTISIVGTNIELNWDDVAGATSYKVYSSDDPYTGFTEDASGTFIDESWSAPVPGVKKFYYVTAVD